MFATKAASAMCLLLACLVGCTGGDEWTAKRPKVYPASGVLKVDGKEFEGATVVFHSQTNDVSAQGITDKSGKFRLTTFNQGDGAVAGTHKVVVTKREYEEKKTKFNSPEENSVALIPKDVLPKRYGLPETTTVQAEVKSGGSLDIVIEITSK